MTMQGQQFEDVESAGLAVGAMRLLKDAPSHVVAQKIGSRVFLWTAGSYDEATSIIDKLAEDLLPEESPWPTVICNLNEMPGELEKL